MTQRIAILDNGLVTNVAVYPDGFAPDGVMTAFAPSNVGKGWTFDGASFAPPTPPAPEPESADRLALRDIAAEIDKLGGGATALIDARFGPKTL